MWAMRGARAALVLTLASCTSGTRRLGECPGANPTSAEDYCISCCGGDLAFEYECRDGAWQCRAGTLPRRECTGICPTSTYDAGPPDTGALVPPDSGTCDGPNPSSTPMPLYCLNGANGYCCGDIGYAFVCEGGVWRCPPNTIPVNECTASCFDAGPPDAGPSPDASLLSCQPVTETWDLIPGPCDGISRDYCTTAAAVITDGGLLDGQAFAACIQDGGGSICVRASACDDSRDAGSCSCGAGPACARGQVCAALPGGGAECRCLVPAL